MINQANAIVAYDPSSVISQCFYQIAAGQLRAAEESLK